MSRTELQRGYGVIRISNEMMRVILGLPEDIVVDAVTPEMSRRLTRVFISSNEPVSQLTFNRGESQQMIEVSHDMWNEQVIERMRECVRRWDEGIQNNADREQSREAMTTLYEQIRGNRDGNDDSGH